MQVLDLLFKPGASCEKYKRPKNMHDFKNKVFFQDLMKTKMEVEKDKVALEKHCYMMFLIEKKASGTITTEEFELFKNI
jgi:hypothetical protein